jgi:non-specific serine/threonine protein kinase/serine/threonine-protein kinase
MRDSGTEHPEEIGGYRILRVLGEGGIGIVYLAEQIEPVRRRVALKVIKVGMDTRQVVARFESERQALALMDHPNIARVLDAGAETNGRPYFVMELVQGVPVTDYCDTHKLGTRDRVALYLDVCAAVQHAHQKGVVHRDLKPSNILVGVVDDKPLVKVIDFGIAKATGMGLTENALATQVGQLLGTPAYMSPEQAETSGVDVDTRTDIYSLGVVLYELLAGALPMDPPADAVLRHALRAMEIPTMTARFSAQGDVCDAIARNRRTDVVRLRRELRGDLECIVSKAMEKDQTRRYQTAEAFAADMRRHLAQQPVLARPRSVGYVFRRFLARHTAGVAAAVVMLIALAAGAGLATAGFLRARDAERVARAEAQNAYRTSAFLLDLFEIPDAPRRSGNDITARELLDRGAAHVRTELTHQPETQATLMGNLGTVYRRLELYPQGAALLEDSLSIRRRLYGDHDARVAESLISLGELRYQAGDIDAAEPLLREALAINEALHLPGSLAVAKAKSYLALVLASAGRQDYAAAEQLDREALEIYRRQLGPNDSSVLLIEFNLSMALFRGRNFADADELLQRTYATAQRVLGNANPSTANYAAGLAEIRAAERRLDDAETLYRSALAAIEEHYGAEHPRFGSVSRDFGLLLLDAGRFPEAEVPLRDALRAYQAAYPDDHARVARSASDLGFGLLLAQKAEAETQLRTATGMYARLSDGASRDATLAEARLADVLLATDRYEDARAAAAQAAASAADDRVVAAYAASVQAAALAALGRRDEAQVLAPALQPGSMQPFLVEHLTMARAYALYAGWAAAADVRELQDALSEAGFQALPTPTSAAAEGTGRSP